MTGEFPNVPTEILIEELIRRGVSSEKIEKAKKLLSEEKVIKEIEEIVKIDEEKIELATDQTITIQKLSTQIISLRFIIGKNSKLCGEILFEDNNDTSYIGTKLNTRFVIDDDSLLLFINDIHKIICQSGNWNDMYKHEKINPVLNMIEKYRNSLTHILDMKGNGKGSEKGYREIAIINKKLIGTRIIKKEDYPKLQIQLLRRIVGMLVYIEGNLEDLL